MLSIKILNGNAKIHTKTAVLPNGKWITAPLAIVRLSLIGAISELDNGSFCSCERHFTKALSYDKHLLSWYVSQD